MSDPRFPGTTGSIGVAYGWIDPNDWIPTSPRVKPSEQKVDEVIKGTCVSSVLTNVLNGQLALCATANYGVRGVILLGGTFSSQSIGVGTTTPLTFPLGKDSNLQWDTFVKLESESGWTFAKLATRHWP